MSFRIFPFPNFSYLKLFPPIYLSHFALYLFLLLFLHLQECFLLSLLPTSIISPLSAFTSSSFHFSLLLCYPLLLQLQHYFSCSYPLPLSHLFLLLSLLLSVQKCFLICFYTSTFLSVLSICYYLSSHSGTFSSCYHSSPLPYFFLILPPTFHFLSDLPSPFPVFFRSTPKHVLLFLLLTSLLSLHLSPPTSLISLLQNSFTISTLTFLLSLPFFSSSCKRHSSYCYSPHFSCLFSPPPLELFLSIPTPHFFFSYSFLSPSPEQFPPAPTPRLFSVYSSLPLFLPPTLECIHPLPTPFS